MTLEHVCYSGVSPSTPAARPGDDMRHRPRAGRPVRSDSSNRTVADREGGDMLMRNPGKGLRELTQRRHVDLVRVSSALCRRTV